jgi:hypothetical protein
MRYAEVQQSLEEFVKSNWIETIIQYPNVAFNSDAHSEFTRLTIVYGEGLSRSVTVGQFRQTGLLILTIFTKPSKGSNRRLTLANMACELVRQVVVRPQAPLTAPAVNLKVPDLFLDDKEISGWVQAQISCPFYYDLES